MVVRKLSLILLVAILSGCAVLKADKPAPCNVDYMKDLERVYICVRETYVNKSINQYRLCNESLDSIAYKLAFNRGEASVAYQQIYSLTKIQPVSLKHVISNENKVLASFHRKTLDDSYIKIVKTEKLGGCAYGY